MKRAAESKGARLEEQIITLLIQYLQEVQQLVEAHESPEAASAKPKLLTIKEVAEVLQISEAALRARIRRSPDGLGATTRTVGRSVYIVESLLLKWLESKRMQ